MQRPALSANYERLYQRQIDESHATEYRFNNQEMNMFAKLISSLNPYDPSKLKESEFKPIVVDESNIRKKTLQTMLILFGAFFALLEHSIKTQKRHKIEGFWCFSPKTFLFLEVSILRHSSKNCPTYFAPHIRSVFNY